MYLKSKEKQEELHKILDDLSKAKDRYMEATGGKYVFEIPDNPFNRKLMKYIKEKSEE